MNDSLSLCREGAFLPVREEEKYERKKERRRGREEERPTDNKDNSAELLRTVYIPENNFAQ